MKVSISRMCRGDGFTYVIAEIEQVLPKNKIVVEGYSESKNLLPVNCYPYNACEKKDSCCAYVLVTPSFSTKEITFDFKELAEKGKVICSEQITISREKVKWSSRINYRTHGEEMRAIRDIEKKRIANKTTIESFLVSEFDKEVIFKGVVICAANQNISDFELFDRGGKLVHDPNIFVSSAKKVIHEGLQYKEVGFTLRIPRNFEGCIVARNSSYNSDGFLYFNDQTLDQYLRNYDPHFYYTVARPYIYPRYVDKQREIIPGSFGRSLESRGNKPINIEESGSSVCFSVVVPLYKTPVPFFSAMCASVINQTYSNWELVLVNASLEDKELAQAINGLNDERIKVVELQDNKGIAENTNEGIKVASGDYIAFFDHDDVLEPNTLYEYARALKEDPSIDALYCDEDLLNEAEEYLLPHFKPDFNLDLLRCHNYVTHFLTVRSTLVKELMLNRDFDGAQDYDFILRVTERTERIKHIGKVLYHWRIHSGSTAGNPESKTYADEAGRKALEKHLERCDLPAKVTSTKNPFVYHVAYEVRDNPLVSILIPNKDNAEVLKRCIDSIVNKTTYSNYEIVIIENNSCSAEIFEYYESFKHNDRIRVVVWDSEFNYSAINNFGVTHTKGEYLLLLNNDTEVIEPNWISIMLSYCQRSDVGIVGARLLYPDNTVQHAGVFMKKCDSADDSAGPNHIFMHLDKKDGGYMERSLRPQDLSAVTAACMMVKRSVYEEVGGFDEQFSVAYNDVDFCLRVREMGLRVVYVPDVELYHYESLSRGADDEGSGLKNYARFISEQGLLRSRWSKYYAGGDPYHGKFATLKLDKR